MIDPLINVILHHKKERGDLLRGPNIRRTQEGQLRAALPRKLIKVITGPRRAGKSTLAVHALKDENFAYVNFEDDELYGISGDRLTQALDTVYEQPEYYLFDEIQSFENWETYVNKLHRRGRNLIITGSNSRLLSSELASSLTGRHEAIELLPFSFEEFLSVKGGTASEAQVMKEEHFHEWMKSGGYPEVLLGGVNSVNYLRTLFDAIILRDIVRRHRIRNPGAIQALTQLLINSIASRFTARSLERTLKGIAFSTIQRYLTYLTEAYLFFELQAFSFKTRERIKSERKIYTIDNGFLFALSQNIIGNEGLALENLVFVELLRRGAVPNQSLFYAQTKNGFEIDFLIPNLPSGTALIQVSYSIAISSTVDRELRALSAAADEFNANQLTIITMNDERRYTVENRTIHAVPMWKWCLEGEDHRS